MLKDNGSQVDIIFYSTFLKMGCRDEDLQQSSMTLYSFGSKRIEPLGEIKLPVSFGDTSNSRTEYITLQVISLSYPYLAILGRLAINTFEVVIHNSYLRMKMAAKTGISTVKGDQQLARNKKKDST